MTYDCWQDPTSLTLPRLFRASSLYSPRCCRVIVTVLQPSLSPLLRSSARPLAPCRRQPRTEQPHTRAVVHKPSPEPPPRAAIRAAGHRDAAFEPPE